MLGEEISLAEIDSLGKTMEAILGEHEILRGWDYYRRGLVYGLVLSKPVIQATVQGTYPYLVRLDLADARRSRCSCPVVGPCKHIAAVFLYLYALYRRPEELVTRYRDIGLSRNSQGLRDALSSRGSRGTQPWDTGYLQTAVPASVRPDNTPEEWFSYLKARFQASFRNYQSTYQYGLYFYSSTFSQLETLCVEWPDRPQSMFLLLSQLFIMVKMEQPTEEERSVFGYYLQYPGGAVQQHQNNLLSLLGNVASEVDREESRGFFLKIAAILRDMLTVEKAKPRFDWQKVYRELWGLLGSSPELLQTELRELERLLGKRTMLPRITSQLAIARAHFIFVAGRDEEYRKFIDSFKIIPLEALLPYLEIIFDQGNLEQGAVWLEWLLPRVEPGQTPEFARICHFWVELTAEPAYHSRVLEVLKDWLPGSSEYYSLGLVHAGHWKEWADFQIFYKRLVTEISTLELKLVEKQDRTLLFPLFHHSIARLINEKNRMAYHRAVRLLISLRSQYKKAGQEHRWENFIDLLAAKYSRLRAFQDELRKGKLLYD